MPSQGRALATPPPDGLKCPTAGTVFTLSMQAGNTGLPVTWASGGQAGWDCVLVSSVSGKRLLWDTLEENPLQKLWPLQPGKTADILPGTGGTRTTHLEVTGYGTYWLPFATVHAWTIDATVSDGGIRRATTRYWWSPDLGWKIGQHTRVWSGGWPRSATPDWQVVAVARPGP